MLKTPSIAPARKAMAVALGLIAVAGVGLAARALSGPIEIEHGRRIYAANCQGCHGAGLQGQPDWRQADRNGMLPAPPLNGDGHAWRHSDAQLFHMIKFSVLDLAGPGYRTNMPAFGGKLSDDQIRAVLAYVKSVWPPQFEAAQSFLDGQPGRLDAMPPNWQLPPDCGEPVRKASTPPPPG